MRAAGGPVGPIHVTTLGGVRIVRGGEEVRELPGQPIRFALFLYLVLERRATRDELAALFWPDRSPERARRSLSQMLYELRGQLGEGWIEAHGERVEVTPAVVVDALEFVAAVEEGSDSDALRRYRGPFLEGWHPGVTVEFEHWLDRRRSHLSRLLREVYRRLAAERLEAGDAQGALAVAGQWAERDPLEDEAHHKVIELLAETGRRSEALRHFAVYKERIARELEVEPLEETQALVARIREGSVPTPGAQEPAGAVPGAGSPIAPSLSEPRRLPWLLGSLAVTVMAGMLVLWAGAGAGPPGGGPPAGSPDDDAFLDPRGVAVLPFLNLSADPEQEYFSDGITEDLLAAVSRIADLRVISRTSVMQYKGTDRSARQIGEELGVAHILEGSVRRTGDRVRIVAQLIDARTDEHLWAESYDRELTDIFAIQSEIAQRIAGALRAQLTSDERERLAAWPTENLTAYDFYLQGRAYVRRARREDHYRGMELYRRAIAMDSSFAPAWVALGEAYALGRQYDGVPQAWRDSALVAARRATVLDPGLAEAHAALGLAYLVRSWYKRAEEALDRALALNPNLAIAVARSGSLKFNSGQYDEAVRLYRRSIALDPATRIPTLASLALTYGALGLASQAYETNELLLALEPDNREARRNRALFAMFLEGDAAAAVELAEAYAAEFPDYPRAWLSAGTAWLFSGEYARAAGYFQRAYESGRIGPYLGRSIAVQLGFTLLHAGEPERARRLFAEFEDLAHREIADGNEDPEFRYSLAALHAIQGNLPEAYHWLDEMVAAGWHHGVLLGRDPLLENLHGEERFERLLARSDAEIERQRARVVREGW